MKVYYASNDVAKVLGLGPAMVRVLRREGTIRPAAKTRGGIYLYERETVDALKKARREEAK